MQEIWEFPQTPSSLRAGDWGSKLWPSPSPDVAPPASAPTAEAAEPQAQPAGPDKQQEQALAQGGVDIEARAAGGHSGQQGKVQDRQGVSKAGSTSRLTARSAVAVALLLLSAAVVIALLACGLGRALTAGQAPGRAGPHHHAAPDWQWPLHRLGGLASDCSSQLGWHSEQAKAANGTGDDRALVGPLSTWCHCCPPAMWQSC